MEFTFSTAQNGIKAAGQRLEVNANNIANITTPGFKAKLAQQATIHAPHGTRITGTSEDFNRRGDAVQSGDDKHMYIRGEGFFQVDRDGEPAYTRLGQFDVDIDGNLKLPSGHILSSGITVPEDSAGIEISVDGIVYNVASNGEQSEIGQIEVVKFANPEGLIAISDTLYAQGPNSGEALTGTPGSPGFGNILHRAYEDSDVDAASEFTQQIQNQRSYQMSLRVFQTVDGLVGRAIDLFS